MSDAWERCRLASSAISSPLDWFWRRSVAAVALTSPWGGTGGEVPPADDVLIFLRAQKSGAASKKGKKFPVPNRAKQQGQLLNSTSLPITS